MSRSSSFGNIVAVAVAAAGALSCSDATGPRTLAGTYVAGPPTAGASGVVGVFTTTESGVTTDQLQSGAQIRLVLTATGQTSGRLVVPGQIDADLAGTWTVQGDLVALSHTADTFLRDMELRARAGRLEGEDVFSGVTVRVVLQRVP